MKKNITKKLLEKAAVNAAKVAAGTASFNMFHQSKEQAVTLNHYNIMENLQLHTA